MLTASWRCAALKCCFGWLLLVGGLGSQVLASSLQSASAAQNEVRQSEEEVWQSEEEVWQSEMSAQIEIDVRVEQEFIFKLTASVSFELTLWNIGNLDPIMRVITSICLIVIHHGM
mmetsp:Transcript_133073/g.332173  ORF Transcript_133073/g.332173 Transcript_133073/m.332173 type:complete len:116 (-) Transcript_133073:52-399(-)